MNATEHTARLMELRPTRYSYRGHVIELKDDSTWFVVVRDEPYTTLYVSKSIDACMASIDEVMDGA